MGIKPIVLGLALAISAWGQGSNTIYQTLVTNSTSAGQVYGPVRSVGQASHQAYIVLSSLPAHSCNPGDPSFQLILEGANVNDTSIAAPIPQLLNSVGGGVALIQGTALYPYVFVSVTFSDPSANCQYSVYYSGSAQGLTLVNNNLSYAQPNAISVPAGQNRTVGSPGGVGTIVQVYGFALNAQGGEATATLSCKSGGMTSGTQVYDIAAGSTVTVTPGTVPVLICPAGYTFNVAAAGAALNGVVIQNVQINGGSQLYTY